MAGEKYRNALACGSKEDFLGLHLLANHLEEFSQLELALIVDLHSRSNNWTNLNVQTTFPGLIQPSFLSKLCSVIPFFETVYVSLDSSIDYKSALSVVTSLAGQNITTLDLSQPPEDYRNTNQFHSAELFDGLARSCPKLISLNLSRTGIHLESSTFSKFSNTCQGLTHLDISYSNPQDNTIFQSICNFRDLRSLYFDHLEEDFSTSYSVLASCSKNLEIISSSGLTDLKEDDVFPFLKVHPNLVYIDWGGALSLTDLVVHLICSECRISHLNLSNARGITAISIDYLSQMAPLLSVLILNDCPNLKSVDFKSLLKWCPQLKVTNLFHQF